MEHVVTCQFFHMDNDWVGKSLYLLESSKTIYALGSSDIATEKAIKDYVW